MFMILVCYCFLDQRKLEARNKAAHVLHAEPMIIRPKIVHEIRTLGDPQNHLHLDFPMWNAIITGVA